MGLGIRLVPKGGRIQFSPREAMPADLLAALHASRDEVLRELARPEVPRTVEWCLGVENKGVITTPRPQPFRRSLHNVLAD